MKETASNFLILTKMDRYYVKVNLILKLEIKSKIICKTLVMVLSKWTQ